LTISSPSPESCQLRARRLVDDLDDVVDPQQVVRAAIRDEGARAVHVLGDDVAMPVLLARVVDRQDVRMLQHPDHVRFGEEHLARDALADLVAGGLDVVDLDRDVASVIRVVREVHDAGAAAPDLLDDRVLADLLRQRRRDAGGQGNHFGTDIAQGRTAPFRRKSTPGATIPAPRPFNP
jgi:hypothetical protein